MALEEAVRAAATYRADIIARLAPTDRDRFARFWRSIAEARRAETRRRLEDEMVSFLIERLPASHEVRRALILDEGSWLGPATTEPSVDADELAAVLADLDAVTRTAG